MFVFHISISSEQIGNQFLNLFFLFIFNELDTVILYNTITSVEYSDFKIKTEHSFNHIINGTVTEAAGVYCI